MNSGDRLIRAGTSAAVLIVADIAAAISFLHIARLALPVGQPAAAAYMLPVSIDGTVACASLVMLRAARIGSATPWLARPMLGLAVAATLGANIMFGAAHGVTRALVSGWPAVSFVGCAELANGMVRRSRTGSRAAAAETTEAAPEVPAVTAPEAPAAVTAKPAPRSAPRKARTVTPEARAARVFRDEIERGSVPSLRQIKRQARVGSPKAKILQAHLADLAGQPHLATSANGHRPTG